MDKRISEAIDRLVAAAEDNAFCGAARPEDRPLIETELKDARRELEQLIDQVTNLVPKAWMRKWAADGEEPVKTRKPNGRMGYESKFKFLPVTEYQCFNDDIQLFALQQGPCQHILFETGDPEAPRQILDWNGEVVLAQCKVCGQAECELEPACPGVRHERV